MSFRSKEKVATALRKLFRTSEKGEGSSKGAVAGGSPGRRLLRSYRDTVGPASTGPGATGPSPAKGLTKRAAEAALDSQKVRARRLMKEFTEIQKLEAAKPEPFFTVELINDNLFEWHVKLFRPDPESKLALDMKEMSIPYILLHLVFPDNFPFAPPFMRVISPRIEKGFVMEGGAICMELLTPRGWASAYTVEAIVMQFAASVVKGQGRVMRKTKGTKDFSRKSAEESFRSLVKTHEKYGWVTPALSDG